MSVHIGGVHRFIIGGVHADNDITIEAAHYRALKRLDPAAPGWLLDDGDMLFDEVNYVEEQLPSR